MRLISRRDGMIVVARLFRAALPNAPRGVKPILPVPIFPSRTLPVAWWPMKDARDGTPEDYPKLRPGDTGWQRTLWAMVGIQFVMTGAISFLSPIIPLMLPQLGVETTRGVDIWSGVITGATSFVAAFASPIWGRIADRHGRKLSLLRSSFAIALFTALMGLATNVWQFFGARAVMGVFAGFSSAAIALVASQVPERRLGYALGWLSSGQLIGSL